MTLLELNNLSTQFDTKRGLIKAVNEVDLTIDRGEIVGLVGESGSGKSVLAKSIMKLIDPPGEIYNGEIQLRGENIVPKTEEEMLSVRGSDIAMVFQDPTNSLNPILPIGEQIAESVRLHQDVGESLSLSAELKRKILGVSKDSTSWLRAIEMLETVEIPAATSRADNYPHEFSGGMRQRAMLAIALASDPDLLIADEPTTSLDVTIQAQILEELKALKDEFDMSILLITHDLPVVAETCDKVNVMYAGEVVERGDVDEIFNNPQHPYTEGLLESTPRLDSASAEVKSIEGTVPDPIDLPYECHFAPRCPEATDECYQVKPAFRNVGEDGHEAACHYRGTD